MNNRYDEVMDKIEVTDEMRNRILQNLQSVNFVQKHHNKTVRFSPIKKYLSVAACFAILLVGVLMLPNMLNSVPSGNEVLTPGTNIAKVSTLEELSNEVGFEVSDITGLPFEVQEKTYTAYWDELAEIDYRGEGQTAVFRKSSGQDDNSGDYTEYPDTQETTVGTFAVTLKGQSGSYVLATWHDGQYSYSLNITNGLTMAEWEHIVSKMN